MEAEESADRASAQAQVPGVLRCEPNVAIKAFEHAPDFLEGGAGGVDLRLLAAA